MDAAVQSFGWLSIIPPIIAIGLALTTKEVISSLLLGIISGALIFNNFNILATISTMIDLVGNKISENSLMLIFLGLLGVLVVVVTMAGGSRAYGEWATTKIKSRAAAQLATSFLGMLIFIDDYFNCLTVGTVMKPVTDKYGISRTKLAYIIDATAAPVCIIAPVSSWAASVISTISSVGIDDGLNIFIQTIPFNLYALLTIAMMLYFCVSKHEVGLMRQFEENDTSRLDIGEDDGKVNGVAVSDKGTVADLVVPIVALIVAVVSAMLYTGGLFTGEAANLAEAFGNASVNPSLVFGSFVGILVTLIMFVPRKLISFKDFMGAVNEGVKNMVPAMIILILAWSIGGICRDGYLNTGAFVGGLIESSNLPIQILPAIVFAVAAALAFSTGTAWGTFGILIPILVPVIMELNAENYLVIILAAIFSGSVFGDHSSPISDTTIMASAGAGCNHIDHVSTQLPYALTVAVACLGGFIAAGFTRNVIVTLIVGGAILAGEIYFEKITTEKKMLKATSSK